jgi:hypothetical protein
MIEQCETISRSLLGISVRHKVIITKKRYNVSRGKYLYLLTAGHGGETPIEKLTDTGG